MNTIKLGSKGEDVKVLQAKLGLSADGIFGVKTDAAVRVFQVQHGLTADGIVGEKTWAKLLNVGEGKKPNIILDPLNVNITKSVNRQIKYIVIHYTCSISSKKGAAAGTKRVFQTRKASSDFCVDDAEIRQFNPNIRNYYTGHCGGSKYADTKGASLYGKCKNSNSIGIEVCSNNSTKNTHDANHEGWYYTESTLSLVLQLVKYLMKEYNIPKENVVRHWDVNGKRCPGIVGWNDDALYSAATGKKTGTYNNSKKWLEFKSKI